MLIHWVFSVRWNTTGPFPPLPGGISYLPELPVCWKKPYGRPWYVVYTNDTLFWPGLAHVTMIGRRKRSLWEEEGRREVEVARMERMALIMRGPLGKSGRRRSQVWEVLFLLAQERRRVRTQNAYGSGPELLGRLSCVTSISNFV